MTGKVIQGSFLTGQPRWSSSVQPKIAPSACQPKVATLPPTAFAGRPSGAPPGFGARRPGFPPPAIAARPPGPPAPAFAGQAQSVQLQAAGGAFAVEAGPLGLVGSGGGKPLPDAVRGKMEAALDADFSSVRVHVGPQAERIGAIAFTVGTDIYFAPGRYQPDSIQGQQLLGHELAHVVQQRAGRVRNPLGAGLAVVQDRALEAEADRLGQRAAAHRGTMQPLPGAVQPKAGSSYFTGLAGVHAGPRHAPVQANAANLAPATVLMKVPNAPSFAARGVVQLVKGDALQVVGQAPAKLRYKKTSNQTVKINRKQVNNEFATLPVGTAGIEMDRSGEWVRFKSLQGGKVGWLKQDQVAVHGALGEKKAGATVVDPSQLIEVTAPPFDDAGPKPQDVSQGGLGDCWLLGTLSGIVFTSEGKKLIKEMISPHVASPVYKVRLFSPRGGPGDDAVPIEVEVDNWFPAVNRKLAYAERTGGIWPLLIEKAVAEVKRGYFQLEGGAVQDALKILTGKSHKGYNFVGNPKNSQVIDPTFSKRPETMLKRLSDAQENEIAAAVHIPPQDEIPYTETIKFERKTRFFKKQGVALKCLIGTASREIIKLEPLQIAAKPSGSVTPDKDEVIVVGRTIEILGPAVAKAANLFVKVSYSTQPILPKRISAGHIYGLGKFNKKARSVSLLNPHYPNDPVEVSLDQLTKLHATFHFGVGEKGPAKVEG